MNIKVGHGYDVHAFCEGNYIMLGGVKIPHRYGLRAHSDGDVLIHAVCDALLGAAAKGDIGRYFPDTDDAYLGTDSRVLLRRVVDLLKQDGYKVGNVDNSIIAQAPKLAPHIEAMRKNLANDLALSIDCINVKATTPEGLGFVGRKEGIEVHCVALITTEN